MLTFTDDASKQSVQDESGIRPSWAAEAFADLDTDVRGFVFDVATGRLNEVV